MENSPSSTMTASILSIFSSLKNTLYFFGTLTLLLFSYITLSSLDLIQDWELRFQNNLYWFAKPFTEASNKKIILIEVNDTDFDSKQVYYPLPNNIFDQLNPWLKKVKASKILFNFIISKNTNVSKKNRNIIKNDSRFILRDHPRLSLHLDFNFSKSGNLIFKSDSSGTLQFICVSKNSCNQNSFFNEILKSPKYKDLLLPDDNWLRINYTPLILNHKRLGASFVKLSLNEALNTPQEFFEGAILIVGSHIDGFNPKFNTPIQNLQISENEALALAVLSLLHENIIYDFFRTIDILILLTFLSLSCFFTLRKKIFHLTFIFFLSICGHLFFQIILFSSFNISINFVLPFLFYILSFSVNAFTLAYWQAVLRLKTTIALKQSKIDFFTNQLHSHHIFNEFSRISVFIRKSPQKAREYLLEFSEMLRYSLKFGDQEKVKVLDQVAFIETYLKQQKIIFDKQFKYTLSVIEEVKELLLPWGLLTPLIENSIKYYNSTLKDGKQNDHEMLIHIFLDNNDLVFKIKNPYDKDSEHFSTTKKGLKNIEERCNLILGKQRFSLCSFPDDQSWVSILRIKKGAYEAL